MRELLLEIWTSVRRNKLRTFLTGFSVAWGIFMLVILLGSGNGLKNGVTSNFGNYATNSIDLYGGRTSKPYMGYQKGRRIRLWNSDLEILAREFPEVDEVAANSWFDNLHQILRSLYEQMMPLCEDMAGVAKGIAGLGALFYVAYRVWQSLARAEPIDVFPMLRPFAIGLCIMFFPTVVLGTINSVLSPIVQGTAKMLEAETLDMNQYREQKDKLEHEAMMRNPETAYLVSNEEFDKQLEELGWSPSDMVTMAGMYIERGMYSMKKNIRDFFREILELMFQAAALVIDTIRTFFLVVLAILGPIAFAISVWDGFQSTLTQWICRYIQVYLWLPVSDMFSTILAKIQVLMLQSDIERMQADPNFSLDSSDGVYIVFMIIGIIGYFTIPTVAGWIIQAGGMGSYGRNVNQTAGRVGGFAGSVAGATAGNTVGRFGKLLKRT